MSLDGHVENGRIVLDQPAQLPEGAKVRVEVLPTAQPAAENMSLLERLGDVVGALDDLPTDLAENHDHYLYGTPKRR